MTDMKKIAVLTATRAEYGLLAPVIKKMKDSLELQVCVIATGMHLSSEFGLTYHEIEQDGVKIHKKIEILLSSDTPVSISKSMGLAMISFAEYFDEEKFDALLVLGDRYETLAVCCAAMNAHIPIFHLYGGETTEGAIDEAVRHSITKMSYLHFASMEVYRRRIIQLGEAPDRVFTVGSLGVENALKIPFLSREELEESIHFTLEKPYIVVTFHPVTLEKGQAERHFFEILQALDENGEFKYIFTKANADAEGRTINNMIDEYVANHSNAGAYESLGARRYLSALKYASMVIGNSSSGLIEAPSFKIPTVNIGDRQKGRVQAESVINCKPVKTEICKAMKVAMSEEFRKRIENVKNPYGDGNASDKIVKVVKDTLIYAEINLQKKFYDISF